MGVITAGHYLARIMPRKVFGEVLLEPDISESASLMFLVRNLWKKGMALFAHRLLVPGAGEDCNA